MIHEIKVKKLTSFSDRLLGKIKYQDKNIFLETRLGIHTFFLKSPIDILVLDKQKNVVKARKTLKPNRLFFWNIKYKNIVELESGSIKKLNINIQDTIRYCT